MNELTEDEYKSLIRACAMVQAVTTDDEAMFDRLVGTDEEYRKFFGHMQNAVKKLIASRQGQN